MDRRKFLGSLGSAGIAGLAGCTGVLNSVTGNEKQDKPTKSDSKNDDSNNDVGSESDDSNNDGGNKSDDSNKDNSNSDMSDGEGTQSDNTGTGDETSEDNFDSQSDNSNENQEEAPDDEQQDVTDFSEDDLNQIFYDDFDDRIHTDKWIVREKEGEVIREVDSHLIHDSDMRKNATGELVTRNKFDAEGTVVIDIWMKLSDSEYWGAGFFLDFGDKRINVEEEKWSVHERFVLTVEGDRIDTEKEKLGPPSSDTSWTRYRMVVDFDENRILKVVRGREEFTPETDFKEVINDTFRIGIGNRRGHRVLYDYVKMGRVKSENN